MSRIGQDRCNICHINELCNLFSSSFTDMTYEYYFKQPMPMCESRLNQILAKNPRLMYRLNWYSNNPLNRKNTQQETIIVNEKDWESLS